MEFIQKKTADSAMEHFLPQAADQEISLVWDRFEGQLPECGFCESGLSCRDCLQGPCISHPFRDRNKLGVCGKDKDILAVQTLLRLVIKGTMAYLDQVSDFVKGVESGEIEPNDKAQTDQTIKEIQGLLENGASEVIREFSAALVAPWKETGICPEGIGRDLFKASQKLEGGMCNVEETLLWAFRSSLLGCMAHRLQGKLKGAVFGKTLPTELEVNLGALRKRGPNILLYGTFSPLLKQKIAKAAQEKNIGVMGVCTDPLVPPYRFPPVTTYGSQEVPLMTGAVDLVVAGDQFVNPSLVNVARDCKVAIVPTEVLKRDQDLTALALGVVDQAEKAFETRGDISRGIPEFKESAVMGFSPANLDVKRIVEALRSEKIQGIALLAGSNNVKYTQDYEIVTMAREFLKNDVLCISGGEASVALAKYGLLNPLQRRENCSEGLSGLLSTLGEDVPAVLDCNLTDLLLAIGDVEKKALKDFPIVACFPEATRSMEVAQAMWTVAMGVSTYFWPCLPVTGSARTTEALSAFCHEKFGSKLHVIGGKMEPRAKAGLFLENLRATGGLSGSPW